MEYNFVCNWNNNLLRTWPGLASFLSVGKRKPTMELQSIFQFCAKIGFWPFRCENDGKIRIVWLYLLYLVAGITLYALMIYRLTPLFTSMSATPADIGEVMCVIGMVSIYTTPLLIFLTLNAFETNLTASKIGICYLEVIGFIAFILTDVFSLMGMRYNLLCNIANQQLDSILVAGLAFFEIPVYFSAFLMMVLICLNLENLVQNEIRREKLTMEAIHKNIKIIKQYERVIRIIGWPMFLLNQVLIVMGTFMMVSDFKKFYMLLLLVLAQSFFLLVFLGKLENSYDLIRDAAMKIRNESVKAETVKEMMKLQIAAMELENCVPFTCSKFFSLTRETLTAMVATTLTYLVVLIQFQQSA